MKIAPTNHLYRRHSVFSFFAISGLLLVIGCASRPKIVKKDPPKAAAKVAQEFRSAESIAKAGDGKKAVPKLKKFVQANPDNEFTGDAFYLMGNAHLAAQQYPEALAAYLAVVNSPIKNKYEVDSTLKAARLHLKLNQAKEAIALLERSHDWPELTGEPGFELDRLRFEANSAEKNHLLALEALVRLGEKLPAGNEREKYRALATEYVDSRFSETDLKAISDGTSFSFVRPLAKFRLGILEAERRQFAKARDYLSDVTALTPGTELAERAQVIINQIDSRSRVEAKTIGVILPLSGKQAAIGYKALRGIQHGLGIYGNRRGGGFRLAIIDSEGNPDVARHAVERLVQEDNVIALIGGLLSKTASAEALKAQQLGIPSIMLSQKAGITQAGDFVFRNALTSKMQVEYLVETAINQLGMKNFAILYPNDAYGVEYANLFWDEVRARGGEIRGAQPYDPSETDFRSYIQRLVNTFYLDDRASEYQLFAKAWNEKNPKKSGKYSAPPPEEILPPIVDFDAVFIPDSVKAVGQIAPMLAYNNVTGVRLLGTNIWNSPGLAQRGQKFVENSLFVDSFLSGDPVLSRSEFFSSYKSTYDEEPGLTEIQAYDSALILRQLITSGENTRASLQARLSRLDNFPGAAGPLSVDANREIRRPLTALTVKDGRISTFSKTQN